MVLAEEAWGSFATPLITPEALSLQTVEPDLMVLAISVLKLVVVVVVQAAGSLSLLVLLLPREQLEPMAGLLAPVLVSEALAVRVEQLELL